MPKKRVLGLADKKPLQKLLHTFSIKYFTTSSFLVNGPDSSRVLVDMQAIILIDSVKKEYGRLRKRLTVMKDNLH